MLPAVGLVGSAWVVAVSKLGEEKSLLSSPRDSGSRSARPLTPTLSPAGRGGCRHSRRSNESTRRSPRRSACALLLWLLLLLLIFNPLGAAVRAGRSGPEGGEDRSPRLFDGTGMSRQKARPALTYPQQRSCGGRRAGCPSLWLLSLGQARESNSGRGSGTKPLAIGETRQAITRQPCAPLLDDSLHSPLRGRPSGVLRATRSSGLRRDDEQRRRLHG